MSYLNFETQQDFINWVIKGNVEEEIVKYELQILLDDFGESDDKQYFIEWYQKQLG